MPPKRANPKTYERARRLRKELTPAERKLWSVLRGNKLSDVKFRRQHAIGNYIVDFVSIKKKLIIELDGSQHLPSRTDVALLAARTVEQTEYDEERTRYLESQGYRVIRFWNNQVENEMDGIIQTLEVILNRSE